MFCLHIMYGGKLGIGYTIYIYIYSQAGAACVPQRIMDPDRVSYAIRSHHENILVLERLLSEQQAQLKQQAQQLSQVQAQLVTQSGQLLVQMARIDQFSRWASSVTHTLVSLQEVIARLWTWATGISK